MNLPPDPENMNDERAEWAASAVDAFADITNMRNAGEDDETILTDLLADLRHWADREGIDWKAVVTTAEMHYDAETSDDN